MIKPYLVFMAGAGSLVDLKELVEPVKPYIRGLCVLLHEEEPLASAESLYLEGVNEELGGGKIIYGAYVGRHHHSRNRILFETGIKEGDYVITLDTLERIPVEFATGLMQELIAQMESKGIDIVYYYAKPYIIRYREDMYYMGTPHESLLTDKPANRVELSHYLPDESKVRVNVRPIKRPDKHHFILHYLRYWLQPASNQNLLGLEHRPHHTFQQMEEIRLGFRSLLRRRGYESTVEDVMRLLKGPMDEELRGYVNSHKILNDAYRYYVLGDDGVQDDHTWQTLRKI